MGVERRRQGVALVSSPEMCTDWSAVLRAGVFVTRRGGGRGGRGTEEGGVPGRRGRGGRSSMKQDPDMKGNAG